MMRSEYRTAAKETVWETTIKRSRFIAIAGPCGSEKDLEEALASVKLRYPGATHYCYAAMFGGNDRFSDNGEPSGTAGRPILQVLRGSGLDDVFCVVVRYFGGILLGTGGLVQAYSSTSSDAVAALEHVTMVLCRRFRVRLSYSEYGRFMSECAGLTVGGAEQEFADRVTVTVSVPDGSTEAFRARIADITRGNSAAEDAGEGFYPSV